VSGFSFGENVVGLDFTSIVIPKIGGDSGKWGKWGKCAPTIVSYLKFVASSLFMLFIDIERACNDGLPFYPTLALTIYFSFPSRVQSHIPLCFSTWICFSKPFKGEEY
jgi:hypothetical protein